MNDENRTGAALPGVHELDALLKYQDGSIVSRMLMKNGGGSVTLFAFDAGEGLSEHTAPFDALAIGVVGKADVSIDGTPHAVAAGQVLLLPAGHPHAVAPVGRFKMLLVMIRGEKAAKSGCRRTPWNSQAHAPRRHSPERGFRIGCVAWQPADFSRGFAG